VSARILECTDLQYLNDELSPVPTLSKTIASLIESKSTLHGWSAHPRLGGVKKQATDVQNEGAVMHKLLLGKGAEIAVINADSFRTNRAKDLRDEALAANKIPVKVADFEDQAVAASKITDAFRSLGYEFTGQSEVAIEWTETIDDKEVLCRCRIDHLVSTTHGAILYDVKRLRSAHPDDVTRIVEDYAFDIQHVAYRRAVKAHLGRNLGTDPQFLFLLCEPEPPYAVNHIELDSLWEDIGVLRWERALRLWHGCLTSGSWPGYANASPTIITPPSWVRRKHLGDDYDMGDVGLEVA
jgi:hypothetical protein